MSSTASGGRRPFGKKEGEQTAESSEFESGLDYGAFIEDDADQDPNRTVALPREDHDDGSLASGGDRTDRSASGDEETVALPREGASGEENETMVLSRDDREDGSGWADEADHQSTASLSREDIDELRRQDTAGRTAGERDVVATRPVAASAPVPPEGGSGYPTGVMDTVDERRDGRDVHAERDVRAERTERPWATSTDRDEPHSQDQLAERGSYDSGGAHAPMAVAGAGGVATQAFSRTQRDPDGRLPVTGPRIAQTLLAILAPIVLLIGVVRLVASPVFLWLEYHRPGFPEDQYGFSLQDRLHYGSAGLDFLFNAAGARYLHQLQADGDPVFTEAEVAHMVDVKVVMLVTMAVGVVLAVVCALLIAYLVKNSPGGVRRALFAGALWFIVAVLVLAVLGVLGWEGLFAGFHQLFFADGTWTFAANDGLIRLYPGQFWIDAAIAIALVSLLVAVVTLIVTAPTRRRREAAWDRRLQLEATRGRWYREDNVEVG
ncbi:TIGR01906 family membrane protein [Micrococcus lylae]|uniref:TIGR01906 family membrane protein n=1 Tax=Micrococcus lylae TaxID=1273 RepID=UPI0021A8CF80|nr:TIGR01906 family membrane protein [Micrococcus lylae]MCT2006366.1 TIGR01906 family membrane protein [Micrococcus lylae]MCT2070319.1 TIGR01906 family membrane protein [Micrococcus lylae]